MIRPDSRAPPNMAAPAQVIHSEQASITARETRIRPVRALHPVSRTGLQQVEIGPSEAAPKAEPAYDIGICQSTAKVPE